MRKLLILIIVGLGLCSPAQPAHAEGVVAERFFPAATAGGYISTDRPKAIGHLRFQAGLVTSFAGSPLAITAGPHRSSLIDSSLSTTALASLGLSRFLEVGVSIPAVLYQAGPGSTAAAALGDIQAHLKGSLLAYRHFGLGLLGSLFLPTGNSSAYSGIGQVSFAPRLLLEGTSRFVRGAVNVGALLRQAGGAGDTVASHELNYSVALALKPSEWLEILGEVRGIAALASPFQDATQSPLEALGGLSVRLRPIILTAAGGGGVSSGYGAPAWRVLLGIRYEHPSAPIPVLVAPAVPKGRTVTIEVVPEAASSAAPATRPDPAVTESQADTTVTAAASSSLEITSTEVITHDPVTFETNRARITDQSRPTLDALAALIQKRADLGTIRIEGHADSTGTPEFNRELSFKRAVAVREALIRRGVAAARIEISAYGATRPVAGNEDETGRSRNRRVAFYHQGRRFN